MHACPECGEHCDCDGEDADLALIDAGECSHDCDDSEIFDDTTGDDE